MLESIRAVRREIAVGGLLTVLAVVPAHAEEEVVPLTLAVEHLQQAGASCYAVANGLTGDPSRTAESGDAVTEYLERQRASVGSCRAACDGAAELTEQVELPEPANAGVLKRYQEAVQSLCSAAIEPAPSVQAYGRRVSEASYKVALAEAEVGRRLEIDTRDEPLVPPIELAPETPAAPNPEPATVEEQVPPEPMAPTAVVPAPTESEPAPAPSSGPGASYWDPKRKEELLKEEKRADEIQRIQEERERLRKEQRAARARAREEQIRKEMADWHADYRQRTESTRQALEDVRALLEGRKQGNLRELCRSLDLEVRALLLDESSFLAPDDELSRTLEGAFVEYRKLASDCLLGRTQKLDRNLRTADDLLARAAERLAPYSLTP